MIAFRYLNCKIGFQYIMICTHLSAENNYKEEDIADSLLYAVTDNLAQQVYLVAKAEKINYACFCGSYVEDNSTIRSIITDKLHAASFYLDVSVPTLTL